MKRKERHRRSVSLEPQAKEQVDQIAAMKGVSANRAIEKAVDFYSQYLKLQAREKGEIVGFVLQPPAGEKEVVHIIST